MNYTSEGGDRSPQSTPVSSVANAMATPLVDANTLQPQRSAVAATSPIDGNTHESEQHNSHDADENADPENNELTANYAPTAHPHGDGSVIAAGDKPHLSKVHDSLDAGLDFDLEMSELTANNAPDLPPHGGDSKTPADDKPRLSA